MKKIIYLFFFIPLMINLAACYDDTGNYDYTDLPDVDIKMQDTVYATGGSGPTKLVGSGNKKR